MASCLRTNSLAGVSISTHKSNDRKNPTSHKLKALQSELTGRDLGQSCSNEATTPRIAMSNWTGQSCSGRSADPMSLPARYSKHLRRHRHLRPRPPVNEAHRSVSILVRRKAAGTVQSLLKETISLPVNYFEMLQVTPAASSETIALMCETKTAEPPSEGFSSAALAARAQILDIARATLMNEALKAGYLADLEAARLQDSSLNAVAVDVALQQAPGLLCLLQESGGRSSTIAEAALDLLLTWDQEDRAACRDLALVAALSYTDMSREAFTATPPRVSEGCEFLESGLEVLKAEGGDLFASELQQSIRDALVEMGPTCLLELLALPVVAENEKARREALQGMRDLLWAKDESGKPTPQVGTFSREAFMKECFLRMTTPELIDFFNAAPADVDAGLLEVYWVALAYLGRAFFYRQPGDVLQGEALLVELEESPSYQQLLGLVKEEGGRRGVEGTVGSAGATLPGTDVPASLVMERAMCSLLLGRVEDSKAWLGLDQNPPAGDPAVTHFVYSNSPGAVKLGEGEAGGGGSVVTNMEEVGVAGENEGGTEQGEEEEVLLPGLCMLLEIWLREVVGMRFRDTCTEPVSLGAYFDDPAVMAFLEEIPPDGRSGPYMDPDSRSGPYADPYSEQETSKSESTGSALISGALGVIKEALHLTPQEKKAGKEEGKEGASELWSREQGGGLGGKLVDGLLGSVGSSSASSGAATAASRAKADLTSGSMVTTDTTTPTPTPTYIPDSALGSAPSSPYPQAERKAAKGTLIRPSPLNGTASAPAVRKAVGMLAAAAVAGLLVYQGATVLRRKPQGREGASVSAVKGTHAPSQQSEAAIGLLVKTNDVEWGLQLIRQWQQVKAAALGKTHELSRLREVLDGQMLELWEDRAKEVEANGWYWEYEFISMDVESVLVSPDKTSAVVTASIQEAARLVDGRDPEHNDSYKSTYKARYELKRSEGTWKITGGTVLR